MGREIRKVPPNWQHPTHMIVRWVPRFGYRLELEYVAMRDEDYDKALAEWDEGKARYDAGERPSYVNLGDDWDYEEDEAGPRPTPEAFRTYTEAEATWFQLFQTVSEGTPVSPPFATLDELSAYLAEHGDFWDQGRAIEDAGPGLNPDNPPKAGWGIDAADRFCASGWAPSMVVRDGVVSGNAGEIAQMMTRPA